MTSARGPMLAHCSRLVIFVTCNVRGREKKTVICVCNSFEQLLHTYIPTDVLRTEYVYVCRYGVHVLPMSVVLLGTVHATCGMPVQFPLQSARGLPGRRKMRLAIRYTTPSIHDERGQ